MSKIIGNTVGTPLDPRKFAEEYTNKVFANALKGSASGEIVTVTDVSPIGHEMSVKVSGVEDVGAVKVYAQGKNLCELGTRTFVQTDFVDLKYPIKGGVTYNVSAFITSTDTKDSVCAMAFYNGDEGVCPNQQFNRQNDKYIVQIKPSKDITKIYLYAAGSWQTAAGDTATFANIMITPKGNDATYEPFIEPTEYTVSADSTVEGVKAIYPSTTLTTDTDGVVISAEYNRDTNKVIEQLTQAIISLGGNI